MEIEGPFGRDIVTPSMECGTARHEWESLGNAKYRCSTCAVFGYRRQITQHMRSRPTDSQGISFRYCVKTTKGKKCGNPAIAKDTSNHGRTRSWRCGEHRI